MAFILQDNYEVQGNELSAYFGGTRRYCQTFQAGANYDITRAEFYMFKQNANDTHVVYCYVYALDGSNKPTGVALATAQIMLADVPLIGGKDWVAFDFAASASLTIGVSYGLVVYCPDADYTDVSVQVDSNQGYANGLQWYSNDGSTWADNSRDQYFRTYSGEEITENVSVLMMGINF